VINEFQRLFGDITVDLDQSERRAFVDALLDSEPNWLGPSFRQMLFRQTRGHPLFTIELLRGMQERGDLIQDTERGWIEGPALDWETLPARVEAAISERISRLAYELRNTLRVASVEGVDFTAEVVAQVVGTSEREMVRSLSTFLDRQHRLVRAQVIERVGTRRVSRYRFRHNVFQRYLYENLDPAERAYLHDDVGHALETLYAGQENEIATIVLQLARHFQEAEIPEKAIRYLHQAGDMAARVSAFPEGIAHLTQALDLLMTLPNSIDRARQELSLQISLAIASKGELPGRKGEKVIKRALELCQQTGETTHLSRILGELAIVPYVRAEYRTARELGEEGLRLAQEAGDPLLVALAHWHMGFVLFALGEFTAARAHIQQMISFYDPKEHHHVMVALRGSDAGVSALAYDACCLWCLGYPVQALDRSQEAVALARDFDHAFTLADVLCFGGCVFSEMRRDVTALTEYAEDLMRVSEGMSASSFFGTGICYQGEAMTRLGNAQEGVMRIREGLVIRLAIGARCYHTGILCGLAEGHARADQPEKGLTVLAEAFNMVDETSERYCVAELTRLLAELHLSQGDDLEAEASFMKAIELARSQEARSWELRAAIGLARLWQRQGKPDDARQVLGTVYDWFSEGFDTADLVEAQALLDELDHASHYPG
jgi:predicted ATPase